MSTTSGPLEEFFTQFNFIGYTYDPDTAPLEEFDHLCQARKWGASKVKKHETDFLLALEEWQDLRGSPVGPNVIKFFREYEYHLFTYDLDAPTQSEFQRLIELRGWGERNLSKVTKRFKKAVALDATRQLEPGSPGLTALNDLLPNWLREQECPGYKYLGGLPELEFKELTRVKRREWNKARRKLGLSTDNEAWKEDEEFQALRTEFYEVVEQVFNLLLDIFCQITGFTPDQVLVGLYGPEQGTVGLYGQGQENSGPYGQGQEGVELYMQELESISKGAAERVRSTKDPIKPQGLLTLIISDSKTGVYQYIRLSGRLPRDSPKPTHDRPLGASATT